jgi:hypothetical protein
MSEVYCPRDLKLKREVAIKVLTDEFSRDSERVARCRIVSVDLLRLRIKAGKYPSPPRSNGNRRLFTNEHVQKLRAIR